MVVHRFMSKAEWKQLKAGKVLRNSSTHAGRATTSRGFCFFTEEPDEAIHWLSGIVNPEMCVTMDVRDGLLNEGFGRYHVGEGMQMKKEYWCEQYSVKDVDVVRHSTRYSGYAELTRALNQILWGNEL